MRCLAASVSAVLGYWGARVVPEALADRVSVYKDGLSARELVGVLGEFGFRGFLVQPPFEDLLHHLEQRRPVIVTVVSGESRHALVLAGFDTETNVVWLNDPATGERRSESMDAFQQRWEEGERWTLLIVPQS
jgi:ABC-type bacteriocin/lantibiotic exporter with double-glycine peptidase domain